MEANTNTILSLFTSSPHPSLSNHVLQLNITSLHPQLRIICTTTKYHLLNCNAKNFNSEEFTFHAEDDINEEEEEDERKKKRKWWSDEAVEEEVPETVLEEFLDSIWILKVFKSLGWTLPPVILSLLLATGLKAFLIALALPFGQSAFSFALQKMWEQPKRKKKRKRTRKTQFTGSTSDINVEEERDESQETRKKKVGYQSWVDGNVGSVNEGARETPSFGGWDELEGPTRRYRRSQMSNGSKRRMMNGRLKRKSRSQIPLLLRLLIAAFPFLSSWTKLFF